MSADKTDDYEGSLADPLVRERRRQMLDRVHIVPLARYAEELRSNTKWDVPDFDPLDGGVQARFLFLFEKPGPKTIPPLGSGFISRNNDDPTAKNTFHFMNEAGINREETVIWNVVPWWDRQRAISASQHRGGIAELKRLLLLLRFVKTVIFVGKRAAAARTELSGKNYTCFESAHPSKQVQNRWPERWCEIRMVWKRATESS